MPYYLIFVLKIFLKDLNQHEHEAVVFTDKKKEFNYIEIVCNFEFFSFQSSLVKLVYRGEMYWGKTKKYIWRFLIYLDLKRKISWQNMTIFTNETF